jgi:secreted trypsin-like serine protease
MALVKRLAALSSAVLSSVAVVPIAVAAPAASPLPPWPSGVIGGTNAAQGAWPDVAAVLYPDPVAGTDDAQCSGTLVAPTVVITAGHCYTDNFMPDNVLIGASSLARPEQGETIPVRVGMPYPSAETSEDVTALILSRPSTLAPRALATGWAAVDIQNDAKVELVGFGSIDKDGMTFVFELQQAETTITDFNCSKSPGCRSADLPNGELGAGGNGIDTCPGDSGGPLYLKTSYGTFLAGVTSRAYSNATVDCSGGGIYERPDKFVAWLEQATGVTVARGPEPTVTAITAITGDSADGKITVNDPLSDDHAFKLTAEPAHGKAGVDAEGTVRVCADAGAAAGADSFQIQITDHKKSNRVLTMTVPFTVQAGTPNGKGCDLTGFTDDAGCCETGHGSAGAIPLAVGTLALVIRRRRRR